MPTEQDVSRLQGLMSPKRYQWHTRKGTPLRGLRTLTQFQIPKGEQSSHTVPNWTQKPLTTLHPSGPQLEDHVRYNLINWVKIAFLISIHLKRHLCSIQLYYAEESDKRLIGSPTESWKLGLLLGMVLSGTGYAITRTTSVWNLWSKILGYVFKGTAILRYKNISYSGSLKYVF